LTCCLLLASAHAVRAQVQEEFQPQVGQEGKDVVWVPTSEALVEKMLDMAQVTPRDFVVDLGSGDGRNIIAAAKRGARGLGVEYNPDMVNLSRRNAMSAGVGDRATFVQGDMYEADFSKATVLALFLLPHNLERLRPKFLELRPGTRLVFNTFAIPDWEADASEQLEGNCMSWCTSLLYFVPAKVAGAWQMPEGSLTLAQSYQVVSGSMTSGGSVVPISDGRMRGEEITFTIGGSRYTGRVNGNAIEGTVTSGGRTSNWKATRSHRNSPSLGQPLQMRAGFVDGLPGACANRVRDRELVADGSKGGARR
jgi:precorrin-6B methylase 2